MKRVRGVVQRAIDARRAEIAAEIQDLEQRLAVARAVEEALLPRLRTQAEPPRPRRRRAEPVELPSEQAVDDSAPAEPEVVQAAHAAGPAPVDAPNDPVDAPTASIDAAPPVPDPPQDVAQAPVAGSSGAIKQSGRNQAIDDDFDEEVHRPEPPPWRSGSLAGYRPAQPRNRGPRAPMRGWC